MGGTNFMGGAIIIVQLEASLSKNASRERQLQHYESVLDNGRIHYKRPSYNADSIT